MSKWILGDAGESIIRATDLARALQTIRVRRDGQAGGTSVSALLAKKSLRATSFDNLFPAMFSIHNSDINDLISKSLASNAITRQEAGIILEAYTRTIRHLGTTASIPVLTIENLNLIISNLNILVNQFNEAASSNISNAVQNKLQATLDNYTKSFNKPLYLIQYIAGSDNDIGSVKLAGPSFAGAREVVNKILKSYLAAVVTEYEGISNLEVGTFLTKGLANWGHTSWELVDPSTGEIQSTILTGKLISQLLSVGTGLTAELALDITNSFTQVTGHINSTIRLTGHTVSKGSGDVLSLVLSSGYFQGVRVQYGKENVGTLSASERSWSIVAEAKANTELRSDILKALNLPISASDVTLVSALINVSSSPTYLNKLVSKVISPLTGDIIEATTTNILLLDSKKVVSKIFGSIGTGKIKPLTSTISKLRTPKGHFTSLTSIQNIINQSLAEQIRTNMGTGSRKDVLNYRTGRFAGSARVERMSQSRDGMVTAFYSYMRNPYGTFSTGGAQEYPKTRDPKLLISKSIREIGVQAATNRMRAVLV